MTLLKPDNTYVPSDGDPASKVWIIGEAPGAWEVQDKKPFTGESGFILETALQRYNVGRHECFITNLCHFRPHRNKFETLFEDGDTDKPCSELRDGLYEIEALFREHKPNVIIALGAWPTWYLTEKDGITNYRGSILESVEQFGKRKVIPTFHPAYIGRDQTKLTTFDFDIKRACEDSLFPELNIPPRNYHTDYWNYFDTLRNAGYLSLDVECVKGSGKLLCVGFGFSANDAVVVPYDGSVQAIDFIQSVVYDSKAQFILHNGIFDCEIAWLNNFKEPWPHQHDTHIQAHVLEPEMPRSLAYLTSIMTRQPFYKNDGDEKSWRKTKDDLYQYNGIDCGVTYEIFFKQQAELLDNDRDYRHYLYEMDAVQLSKVFTRNGLLRDPDRHGKLKAQIEKDRNFAAGIITYLAGKNILLTSPKQVNELLYEDLKLPKRYNKGEDGESKLTSDDDALVSLIAYCKGQRDEKKTEKAQQEWERKLNIVKYIKKIRGLDKQLSSYFNIDISDDGRVRSLYKPGATETGRWSASLYVNQSGLNAQTIPRDKIKVD